MISEESLALKLAKRLSELSSGIETDIGGRSGEEYDFVITDDDMIRILPVSEALDRMEGKYFNRTGKRLQRSNQGPRGLFIFTSGTGGSGLTSVSFTFARHMAGKLNKRVLYVDADSYDPPEYQEPVHNAPGNPRELVYLMKSGLRADLNDFVSKDRYGPDVISLMDPDREVLIGIIEDSGYEYVVVSGRNVQLKGNARIEVVNSMDRRRPQPDREADIRVFNKGTTIPQESESFIEEGSGVRIDMSGFFSLAVGTLFREVMDGYGYGRPEKYHS